ncbi:MAG: transketolase C-terminal domain-containing protein [Halobacteriota archaeon]|nr:transketolase C-terminal domain-containing protein [Halobacteriota archaeon]
MEHSEGYVYVTGNEAAARAVKIARPKVIAAYPITPQTEIVETLARYVEYKELDSRFIDVESEHSAISACIGAASMGARTFTATSSHGLLYMSEMIRWTANARLPIVMVNVNRALGPGWNIWADHNDSLSQRDTGWIQFYTSTVQEVYDTVLMAYCIAENRKVMLPVMINLDGFILSHIMQPLELVDEDEYQKLLGPIKVPHALNFEKPHTLGNLVSSADNYLMQRDIKKSMLAAYDIIKDVEAEFEKLSGRSYSPIGRYMCDDADVVIIAMGTLAKESEAAASFLREDGRNVGVVKISQFRPFPREVVELSAERFVILDRDYSPGYGGILAQEIKSALYEAGIKKEITSIIAGLGGQEVTCEMIAGVIDERGEKWLGV